MCTITETLPGSTLLQEQDKWWMMQGFQDQHAENLIMSSMSKFIH